MSCVPSMNAYVACHTCHKDTASSAQPAVTTGINCDHGNIAKQQTIKDVPNTDSPSLFRHVFRYNVQQASSAPSSPRPEHSSNNGLLAKIKLRMRTYSGDSESSER
ncbi:uncharacterized protein LOC120330933 [Styela clava]|uniref:uncharacterized protein LOC120330933 n=1 Tax=Styela clava TaxID=7725 RepID=UPI001939D80E|nr:uncharacterized protein LOC120330933 [Styela clava]